MRIRLEPIALYRELIALNAGHGTKKFAIHVICAARAEELPIHDDPANGTYQVSAFVQITRLRQGCAFTVVRHEGLEVVGERFDPARGALAPEPRNC